MDEGARELMLWWS